jgi:hypothetical protein
MNGPIDSVHKYTRPRLGETTDKPPKGAPKWALNFVAKSNSTPTTKS